MNTEALALVGLFGFLALAGFLAYLRDHKLLP